MLSVFSEAWASFVGACIIMKSPHVYTSGGAIKRTLQPADVLDDVETEGLLGAPSGDSSSNALSGSTHHLPHTVAEQVGAAMFYAISSLSVIFVNKIVLSSYAFPSSNTLALAQFTVTAVSLWVLKILGISKICNFSMSMVKTVAPLTIIFLMNVLSGLVGTKRISLPMFTVLRRFSILITMLMEHHFLKIKPSALVQVSVLLMLIGAVVASLSDLSFDAYGYMMIFTNNFFTAAYGIAMKKVMQDPSISKSSVMYYNAVFSSVAMMLILGLAGEVDGVINYPEWSNTGFMIAFALASSMGSILNYSIFVCTNVNTPLTTTVVGALKNILTSYLGMVLVSSDYQFAMTNFMGMNISIMGSLLYTFAKYAENLRAKSAANKALSQKLSGVKLLNLKSPEIEPTPGVRPAKRIASP